MGVLSRFFGGSENRAREVEKKLAALGAPMHRALENVYDEAMKGDPSQQAKMGMFRANGMMLPRDYSEARTWYTRAASQGDTFAQRELGMLYLGGEHLPKDLFQAYILLSLAVLGGDQEAVPHLDAAIEQIGPGEMEAAQEFLATWKPVPETS